jgi:hypothetical protein
MTIYRLKVLRLRRAFRQLVVPVVAFICTTPQLSYSQIVTGRVVEAGSERRVDLAWLELVDTAGTVVRTAHSDTAGFFRIDARQAGTYRLKARRLGYGEYVSPSFDLQRGETITVGVRMSPEGLPLEPLVVRARGGEERGRYGFERRCALGRGVCLTVDSIMARHPRLVSDAFYGIPGVVVEEGMGSISVYSMYGGKCFVMFRDHWPAGRGVGQWRDPRQPRASLSGPLGMSGQGPINELKLEWVRGIEIYRDMSEVPRELRNTVRAADLWPAGQLLACGLIWIWTDLGW